MSLSGIEKFGNFVKITKDLKFSLRGYTTMLDKEL